MSTLNIKNVFTKGNNFIQILNSISGLGTRRIGKLYDLYEDKTEEFVTENPYRLIQDIPGIGFETADKIAQAIGFNNNELSRYKAGIVHTLDQSSNFGHTYLDFQKLNNESAKLLGINLYDFKINEAIDELVNEKQIIWIDDDKLGLPKYVNAESYVFERLNETKDNKVDYKPISNDNLEGLTKGQSEAFQKVAESQLSIITGAPGTGKTFLVRRLIDYFNGNCNIKLAAPTGKAAKRLSELSGYNASTIHRLLKAKFIPGKGFGFLRNQNNPLDCDILIIDEFSMVDIRLAHKLLLAIKPNTKLIFIGDPFQLPPVGAGNLLRDIISSKMFNVIELNEIVRQGKDSDIITICHDIKNNKPVSFQSSDNPNKNTFFFKESLVQDIFSEVIDLAIGGRIINHFKHDNFSFDDIQIITARRDNSPVSAKTINDEIHKRLFTFGKNKYLPGDRVVQLQNDYKYDIMNGDIGKVKEVNNLSIVIDFDGIGNVEIKNSDLNIDYAYAITCHKFQGSESPVIIIPIHKSGGWVANRNWLYTAISRAKKYCILVGDMQEFNRVARKVDEMKRNTLFPILCSQRMLF